MSLRTDLGECSLEEGDLLENVDRKVELVSSSSSCGSPIKMEHSPAKNDIRSSPYLVVKLHSSCNDLSQTPTTTIANTKANNHTMPFVQRSASCENLKAKLPHPGKYSHVQSKVKQYFKDVRKESQKLKGKPLVKPSKEVGEPVKEEYLEEINQRLVRELEEKNTMLMTLQENYELLLLKYAEAQNKIDQLRFKSVSDPVECNSRNHFKPKSSRTSFRVPLSSFHGKDNIQGSKEEEFAERGVLLRPQSLPIDCSIKILDSRDIIKAATPTDSEGVSSVITSMSGHSKILNTLEEENDTKPPKESSDFVLESNTCVSDPYDKVKNWQNSLPPLEMIETPETTLYDPVPLLETEVSPSTNYNEISKSAPVSVAAEAGLHATQKRTVSQSAMKKYLRTLSLPGSLSKRNLMAMAYKRRGHHTVDVCTRSEQEEIKNVITEEEVHPSDIPASVIIHKQRKKPPFMRSASLPVYDYDSPKSMNGSNGVYIPPLDLGSLTISDDITTPEFGYKLSSSNIKTSPSFVTSRVDSVDSSFQTLQSLNSCKATISEFSDTPFSRGPVATFHKSTSITPDRSKDMVFPANYDHTDHDSQSWCNVCGETIVDQRLVEGVPPRAVWRPKHPFNRSVSFHSDNMCPQGGDKEDAQLQRNNDDSLDQFDMYAHNLKTRSKVIMKALTAHVNNS